MERICNSIGNCTSHGARGDGSNELRKLNSEEREGKDGGGKGHAIEKYQMKKPWLDEENTEEKKLGGGLPPNSSPLFSACYLAVDRSCQWTSWHCANKTANR